MTGGGAGPVRVLMVAIGGYGYYYLQALLGGPGSEDPGATRGRAVLAGVVDPEARRSRAWPLVAQMGVPVCDTIEQFYRDGHMADLAVIVSPIHWHVPQSIAALSHGSHVLCDKPLGATVQEADALAEARTSANRFVMIGYQWSFSAAIQALKRDILAGVFGRPRRFSALCAWPRDDAYYRRNNWAGRLRDEATGRLVLDSPANNAMAHSLHNLLYLAGPAIAQSATPLDVAAEMYRAHDIESADTTACRVRARAGADDVEILFLASHATEAAIDPRFRLEFDDAVVTFGEQARSIVARSTSGRETEYGDPDTTPQFQKLFDAVALASAWREGVVPAEGTVPEFVCGPEAARAQTVVVNAMHASVPEIGSFPPAFLCEDGGHRFVRGLGETLDRAYREWRLPGELGIDWATPGRPVQVEGSRLKT